MEFNLEAYLSNGVEKIVKDAIKATLHNPKESIFLGKYAIASKKAEMLRKKAENQGEHIPPFLIASITSRCNLYCTGCYSRANNACTDKVEADQLTDTEWLTIFQQAKDIGIGFILLAGGEPLIRTDVLKAAGKIQDILFPIFTNGTMLNLSYLEMFSKYRNLVPVISMEGLQERTDKRRGKDVYAKLLEGMEQLHKKGIIYGASVTVTKDNLKEVTSDEFLKVLNSYGCNIVFYIEYVPVDSTTKSLAPTEEERTYLNNRLLELRENNSMMLIISFPGDEKSSGGCLAAGRGFFHINSHGGVEPCPFSPYSDTNLRNVSLKEALQSPLFKKLNERDILLEEHDGGCVLFQREEMVRALLSSN